MPDEVQARRIREFLVCQDHGTVTCGGNAGNLDQFRETGTKTCSCDDHIRVQGGFLWLFVKLCLDGAEYMHGLSIDFPDLTNHPNTSRANVVHKGIIENRHDGGPGELLRYPGDRKGKAVRCQIAYE